MTSSFCARSFAAPIHHDPSVSRGCSRNRQNAARPSCSARRAGTETRSLVLRSRTISKSPRPAAARGPSTARRAGSASGGHHRAADRGHLLLATGGSRLATTALLEPRELRVDESRSRRVDAVDLAGERAGRRFSSTVRCWKQCRPSITWHTPIRTSSSGVSWSTRSPMNSIVPFVTSPRSARSRFEIAFSVVVLPLRSRRAA